MPPPTINRLIVRNPYLFSWPPRSANHIALGSTIGVRTICCVWVLREPFRNSFGVNRPLRTLCSSRCFDPRLFAWRVYKKLASFFFPILACLALPVERSCAAAATDCSLLLSGEMNDTGRSGSDYSSDTEDEWPVEFRSDLAQAAHIRGPQAGGGSAPPSPNLNGFGDHQHHVRFMESSGEVGEDDLELGRMRAGKQSKKPGGEEEATEQLLPPYNLDGENERELLARVEGVETTDYQPLKGGVHMRRLFSLAKPEVHPFSIYYLFIYYLFIYYLFILFRGIPFFFAWPGLFAAQWLMLLGGTISLVVSSGSMLMLPQFAGDIIDAVSKDGGTLRTKPLRTAPPLLTHHHHHHHHAQHAEDKLYRALFMLAITLGIGGVFTLFRVRDFTTPAHEHSPDSQAQTLPLTCRSPCLRSRASASWRG